MRDAQKRSVESTGHHLEHLINTVEPHECRDCVRNAGYGPK